MLRRKDPATGDEANSPQDDEARIRADERANVEREMRTSEDDPRSRDDATGDEHRDRDRDGVDDRLEGDDSRRDHATTAGAAPVGDDRMMRDNDRDGVDERLARDDRDDRDDRVERDDRGRVAAGGVAAGARHDRDRNGVDDRVERDHHDRDRDGIDDRRDDRDGMLIREDEPIEVERVRAFSFGQLLTMLAGAALVVLGIVALIDTGVDTPLSDQQGEVLGWSHSALLGIVEIVAGALLLIFSLRPGGRWLVALVGLALVVGGVMILGELDWAVDNLNSEQSFAWVPIVAGLIALLASLLTPRRRQRMTGVPVVR